MSQKIKTGHYTYTQHTTDNKRSQINEDCMVVKAPINSQHDPEEQRNFLRDYLNNLPSYQKTIAHWASGPQNLLKIEDEIEVGHFVMCFTDTDSQLHSGIVIEKNTSNFVLKTPKRSSIVRFDHVGKYIVFDQKESIDLARAILNNAGIEM